MIRSFPLVRASYAASDTVQQTLSRALLDAKREPGLDPRPYMAMLAYEMDPTYTIGRRQVGRLSAGEINHLKAGGKAAFTETLRGGHTTFHGPGQAVLYPVLDLQALKVKVRDYVCILEKSIIQLLGDSYAIAAEQRPGSGMNGVWIAGTSQKIASVGVHVRRNVTTHGLALNVDVDPFWFNRIVACNLPDARMVSMQDFVPGNPLSVGTVSQQLSNEILRRLGVEADPASAADAQALLLSARSAER